MVRQSKKTRQSDYLVKLLSDSRADDSGVESGDIDSDERRKRFGPGVGLDHVPKNHSFPFCAHIVCVFPPHIARHFHSLRYELGISLCNVI